MSTEPIKHETIVVTVDAQEQAREVDRCPLPSSQIGILVKLVQYEQGLATLREQREAMHEAGTCPSVPM
jgi:hypothetical protein